MALRDEVVHLNAHIRAEYDWVARDGRAWAFRLVEVVGYFGQKRVPIDSSRVAVLMSEDDFVGEPEE